MGRPIKLTGNLTSKIVDLIQKGNNPRDSAMAVGIAASTYYLWMSRGRAGIEPFSEFLDRIERAEIEARIGILNRLIEIGTQGGWRALAWWLERTDPEHFGKGNPKRLEIYGSGSQSIDNGEVSVEDIEAAVQQVLEVRRDRQGR